MSFVAPVDPHRECVSEIAAFVRGDRPGLIRLKQVLSSIFIAFPGCDQEKALLQCGLYPHPGPNGFMTFFLNPNQDGQRMVHPGWRRDYSLLDDNSSSSSPDFRNSSNS